MNLDDALPTREQPQIEKKQAPRSARGRLARNSRTALYWSLMGFCLITLVRPQDVIPGLGSIKPGLMFSVAMLITWVGTKNRDYLIDPIPKLLIAFLCLIASGALFAVNPHVLSWAFEDVATFTLAFSLAFPAVARSLVQRRAFIRFLLLANLFTAYWVITHNGHGQGGHLGDENDASLALNIGVCLCFAVARFDRERTWRLLATAGVFFTAFAVVITGSRGGFVGLIAAGLAIAIFSRELLRALFSIAVVVLLVLPFVPANYTADMMTITDPNDLTRTARIYSWHRGTDMFLANPVFGVGANNYPFRVHEYENSAAAQAERNDRRSVGGRAAHSLYFTLLPETGTVGVVLYLSMLITALIRCWKAVRRPLPDAPGDDRRLWAYFVGSALVAFSAGGTFVSVLYYPHFWMLVSFTILLAPTVVMHEGEIRWETLIRQKKAQRMRVTRKLPLDRT